MKQSLLLISALLVFSFSLYADDKKSVESQAERFFAMLADNKIDEAVDALVKGSAIERRSDQVSFLKSQLKSGFEVYGSPSGFSIISSDAFGDSVYKVVYSQNFKDVPLIWVMFFYKSGGEWRVTNFDFNDQFKGL